MPLFNNRAGNRGSGKGFLVNLAAKRNAVNSLHNAAGWSGAHNAYGFSAPSHMDRQGDPFGNNSSGPFSAPNHQDVLDAATAKAREAGVSERKIGKVINKTREIGNNFGVDQVRKTSPFQ